jgi:uncharacterized membrane protein YgdD (TMEM256/DUF423 family)
MSALLGAAAGAFGASGLKGRLDPAMLSVLEMGVQKQDI